MIALWGAISASPLFRKIVVILGLVLAVLLALAGFRRKSEEAGKLIEREAQREEVSKARARMEKVTRPDRPDVTSRLRRGDF